ncbi:MAG: histidine kinase, partial [Acidobacteriota bacterium]
MPAESVLAKDQSYFIPINMIKDRLSLFWALQIVGWTGYALDRYLSAQRFFPANFIYLCIAFLLTCFLLRPIYKWFWAGSRSVLAVGLLAVFCSSVAGFLWLVISSLVFWCFSLASYPDVSWQIYLADTLRSTLIHHKPFLFLSWSALYFAIKYWQEAQQRKEQALTATALAREAELKMLRYQLNPHFLFNSLNSVSALIRENPERAERMLNELSEFLRYSLMHTKVSEVPLKDELEAIRNYLNIEKIRFEEKLDVHFDIKPSAEPLCVPSFLLHPLIENAIKFGMQMNHLPLTIEIKADYTNDSLYIEV